MHGQALTMGNLPEDPPIVNGVKTVQIKKNDYHKGLVPKQVSGGEAIALTLPLTPARMFGQHTSGLYALHHHDVCLQHSEIFNRSNMHVHKVCVYAYCMSSVRCRTNQMQDKSVSNLALQ